jgi:outer membrane receptor protein involved in Fe transport
LGVRSELFPRFQTTVSLWGLESASELVFAGDTGATQPSRPGRRRGIECAGSWSPLTGLLLDADLALSRARFTDPDPSGDRIPGSVESVLSAEVAAGDVAGFSGSARLRYFGPRSLTADDSVRSKSSTLVNVELGREILPGARLGLEIFNVFNARVSDVDYYYVSRLPGEPAAGVADVHTHPAGRRTARVFVSSTF